MLHLTCDRKTKFYPTQCNSFGLLPGPKEAGGTCPYSTRGCGGCFHVPNGKANPPCYAYNLMKIYKCSRDKVAENTKAVREAKSVNVLARLYMGMLDTFRRKNEAYSKRNGVKLSSIMKFRWHWTGDIETDMQAKAMSAAMLRNPDIQFWIYTRTFRLASTVDAPNLILYLSIDDDNWEEGAWWFFHNGWHNEGLLGRHKMAYMAKRKDSVLRMVEAIKANPEKYRHLDPESVVKWCSRTNVTSCPADAGNLDTEFACSRCRQCTTHGNQLLFFQC